MNIGIYEAGHLTRSLIRGFEFANVSNQILLYNRTIAKAVALKNEFTHIQVVNNLCDIVEPNSFIFVIIPPGAILEFPDNFVTKIKSNNSILVSCANYITLDKLNVKYPKLKIIRLLSNILWQIGSGTILYSFNEEIEQNEKQFFLQLISELGDLIEIKNERDFDRFGKIMTCGPGIFSKLISMFINDLDIKSDNEKEFVIRCLLSTLNYSINSKKSFESIIEEVANKGGLTECAIDELDKQLTGVFNSVFKKMDEKIVGRREQMMEK